MDGYGSLHLPYFTTNNTRPLEKKPSEICDPRSMILDLNCPPFENILSKLLISGHLGSCVRLRGYANWSEPTMSVLAEEPFSCECCDGSISDRSHVFYNVQARTEQIEIYHWRMIYSRWGGTPLFMILRLQTVWKIDNQIMLEVNP